MPLAPWVWFEGIRIKLQHWSEIVFLLLESQDNFMGKRKKTTTTGTQRDSTLHIGNLHSVSLKWPQSTSTAFSLYLWVALLAKQNYFLTKILCTLVLLFPLTLRHV